MTAPDDRLAQIAHLVSACPPPDMAKGYDESAHGTLPCANTHAASLAIGRDRDQEVRAVGQAAAQQALFEDVAWEQTQERLAAEREGRLPYWEPKSNPRPGER